MAGIFLFSLPNNSFMTSDTTPYSPAISNLYSMFIRHVTFAVVLLVKVLPL